MKEIKNCQEATVTLWMKVLLVLFTVHCSPFTASAQRLLTLDSCRAMALRNNKQLSVSKVKQEIATNLRRSARTKYLPHVNALGSYVHNSEEISILNNDQKDFLTGMGTNMVQSEGFQAGMGNLSESMNKVAPMLAQMGVPLEELQALSAQLQQMPEALKSNLKWLSTPMTYSFKSK